MSDPLGPKALYRLGHQLAQPVSVIRAFGELLQDEISGSLNAEQEEQLRMLLGGASELERMISGLHQLANVKRSILRLRAQSITLDELAEELMAAFAARAQERGVVFEIDTSDELESFISDREQLVDALNHLLSNAIERVARGGRVTLSMKLRGRQLAFELSDDGPGVAPEESDLIFEPFQVGSHPAGGSGLGLGLALARTQVEGLGGKLLLLGDRGSGAHFDVELPISGGWPSAAAGSDERGRRNDQRAWHGERL